VRWIHIQSVLFIRRLSQLVTVTTITMSNAIVPRPIGKRYGAYGLTNGTMTSIGRICAVLSRSSAMMCAKTRGSHSGVVKSCSLRIARFDARKSSTDVRSASPESTDSDKTAKAVNPVIRARNQKVRSSTGRRLGERLERRC